MAILTAMRRSRTTLAAVLIGSGGLVVALGAFGACGKDVAANSASNGTVGGDPASARTPTYGVDVIVAHPHDPTAFTQGLVWHDNRLFESTGQVGRSNIREVDLNSGRVLRSRALAEPHFGEGIVILGDNLYQITWETGKAFVYDWKTFAPKGEFSYEGQGWGLTTDGTSIIMSDGTSTLYWRDPVTFAVQKTLAVEDHGTLVTKLNELEWVKGEIWANVWESDQIVRIDPTTGKVTGWIDLKGLLKSIDRHGNEDVLNGIAYDAERDRYFVTGKLWSKLFEIRIKSR